jgi:FtsP/CotA-like multicopper oxidase with cupredoxin domain
MRKHLRLIVASLATALIVVPLGWMWWTSLLPDEYSVMEMGYLDLGGGEGLQENVQAQAGPHSAGGINIAGLGVDPARGADVRVDLVAREERYTLASGREVDGYSLNGQSPGPVIRAEVGDLVEVRIDNVNVADGITLHWHGVDVPNSADGVAGVTQNAVLPGGRYTYRFVAEQVGTYWYHSHQVSHVQVRRGLLGALVVTPPDLDPEVLDLTAVVHMYDAARTVNGQEGDLVVDAEPGVTARVRVVNTDNGPMPIWVSGASYRVLAVDGYDVNEPAPVTGQGVILTAGGRVDLEVTTPDDGSGARVEMGGSAAVVLGRDASTPAARAPREFVDLLSYGSPAPIGFDPDDAARRFEYVVDRRPGFLDGRPGLWWTVNGHLYPDIPMFVVSQGDVAVMRLVNNSGDVHPMHLHGHHAVVISRDGEPATGSPWWVDSLNVDPGETYEIAFLADNPGVWMDHCHNLPHAAEGLVAHLMYDGFHTPFSIGGRTENEPE